MSEDTTALEEFFASRPNSPDRGPPQEEDPEAEPMEEQEDTEAEKADPRMSYVELLYHACFNDESHSGVEKVAALAHNLNVVSDATRMSDHDLELIQLRGVGDVDWHDLHSITS